MVAGAGLCKPGFTALGPNGPCRLTRLGCTNRTATNYDSLANKDDGGCAMWSVQVPRQAPAAGDVTLLLLRGLAPSAPPSVLNRALNTSAFRVAARPAATPRPGLRSPPRSTP